MSRRRYDQAVYRDVGLAIWMQMKMRQIEQKEIADLLGISVQAVSQKLNGQAPFMLHEILLICEELLMSFDDLLHSNTTTSGEHKMIDLNIVSKQALRIARARSLRDKDVLKHLSGEVIEAQEALSKLDYIGYSEELADVIICACSAAAQHDIDIVKAIENKMSDNAERIPHRKPMISTGRNSVDE